MKLTKFLQSCVLVEDDGKVALFDPDAFTWGTEIFPIASLDQLDYILITHQHADHYSLPFVQALVAKFPNVQIFAAPDLAEQLKAAGLQNVKTSTEGPITITRADHESMEPIFDHPIGDNVAIDFNGTITHPGDSYQIDKSCDVLCLPVDAPWGSNVLALRLAEKLHPKIILPVHDVMLTDDWKRTLFDWCERLCKKHDIQFIRPITGKAVEI